MVNLHSHPQLITIPAICSGALFFGFAIFLFIYLRTKNSLYLSTALLSFIAFAFVVSEGLVIFFGTGKQLLHIAVQFHRLEQLVGAAFLFTTPFFFYQFLNLSKPLQLLTKMLTAIGLGATVFITLIAFSFPDLFISITNIYTETIREAGQIGRGFEGPVYSVRDILLGVYFIILVFLILVDMITNRRSRYLLSVLIGLVLTGFFAADDIIHIYTKVRIGFFPNTAYSRFPLGITFFLILTMAAVLRKFINTSNEVEKAYAALNQSEERFDQIARHIDEVFWLYDPNSENLLFISQAFKNIWGLPSEKLYTSMTPWFESINEEDIALIEQDLAFPPDSTVTREYRIKRLDNGDVRWIRDKIYPIRDEKGNIYRIARVSQDITEQKQAEEKLIYLAYHDSLTGLPNRKSFYNQLERSLSLAGRSRSEKNRALLFIDLDHFKDVNDSLGHITGDRLLQEATTRLIECIRSSDELFRLAGDEFTIILNHLTNETDAAYVGEKIINSLGKPFILGGHEFSLGTSIGIAVYPRDGADPNQLIANADNALYEAKKDRNTFRFYTHDMQKNAIKKVEIISLLRNAADKNELALHYQPQVDKNGNVIGAEALLRWKNPELGDVSPALFIPLAEETGLMIHIGNWVLEQSCRDAARWREENLYDINISVNLSTKQLKSDNITSTVESLLNKYRIKAERYHLEITESALMEDTDVALSHLREMNDLGLNFSIDDFGTGYSSLSYLKTLPIETVKIDRSFIMSIPDDKKDSALVRAIIDMVLGLGLQVIAEGADSKEQVEFLHSHNCPYIQGFYYSKPLPLDQFIKFAKKRRIE
jgi:diguanylate cyclase (GGDEF)-like protein/PAS domain S-box-containing protein